MPETISEKLIVGSALQIKLEHRFDSKHGGYRIPLLPAKPFVHGGRDVNVTVDHLNTMAANMRSGAVGALRPVTIAHPDLSEAEAHGWIQCYTAEVSAYGDTMALYAVVEFTDAMLEKIKDKKFGFISPVFYFDYVDQTGNEIGATLVALGVTNNPHWVDQPALWEAFTANIDRPFALVWEEVGREIRHRVREPGAFKPQSFRRKKFGDGIDAIMGRDKASGNWEIQALRFDKRKWSLDKAKKWVAQNNTIGLTAPAMPPDPEENTMDDKLIAELKTATELTAKYQAEIDGLRKAAASAQTERDNAMKQSVELTAAHELEIKKISAERDALAATIRQRDGELLIKSYEGKIRPVAFADSAGKPTAFAQLAFDNPEQFKALADVMIASTPELPKAPVGNAQAAAPVSMTAAIIERAKKIQTDSKCDYKIAMQRARKEIEAEQK